MPYVGYVDDDLHTICHQTADQLRADFAAALVRQRAELGADWLIADAVRWLCAPGQKRKTIRVDELRALIAKADATIERNAS